MYFDATDQFRFILEIIFVIGLGLWFIYTIYQIATHKKRSRDPDASIISWFWSPWWNLLHSISLIVRKILNISHSIVLVNYDWSLHSIRSRSYQFP